MSTSSPEPRCAGTLVASLLLTSLALLTLPACAQKVYIKTDPTGAQATLEDGRTLGRTPMTLKSNTWAWTTHKVTLSQEGYKPKVIEIDAGPSPANIALCAIGICALWMAWPICVAGRYKENDYAVELEKDLSLDLAQARPARREAPLEPAQTISFTPRPR